MFATRKKHLIGLALLLGVGAGGLVYSADGAMGKGAYEAAQHRIETQAKAQRKACGRFEGQPKEVCEAQAKGWEKIAKAELQARRKPGPEAEKELKFARADAEYGVAKERCGLLKGHARDTCIDRAKHEREAAVRLAKVEKVEEVRALAREARQQQRQARQHAPAAGSS
ncbi:MAG TPA: hypothetical protein VFM98_06475 [Ramlibacter sp.]|uniref:hypothetical protein n=1 Tax=Ramlibacter sp. TaxID=1917967 RepID=UPI002D7EB56A|nr:hypothetical protein [Ramlibacter sp.]HET8745229.1 hypothetical protein [Ramlibacter sp.]